MALALVHGIDRLAGAHLQLLDHALDLLRGFLGAMGQITHFVGHHCETTTRFTGTRGLDGGVERQQVGLLGNAGDHFENLADVDGFTVERLDVGAGRHDQVGKPVHGGDVAIDHLLAFFSQTPCRTCMLRSLRRIAGDLLGGSAQLVDGGRHAVGAVGLFVGIGHRRIGRTDHTQRDFVHLLGGRGHFTDRAVDTLDEAVEGVAQDAELVVMVDAQALGEVAFALGDVLHGPCHGVQRLHQHTDQQPQQGDDDHHGHHGGDHGGGAERAEHREGLVLVHRQADVPVGRRQAGHRCERQQAGMAVTLHFGQLRGELRCALGEQV